MKQWIRRGLAIGIVAFVSYGTYNTYRSGYFSLPELPDGAYPISFKSGFRAILLDADVTNDDMGDDPKFFRRLSAANRERKYLGTPFEVQSWFRDAWSWCKAPTGEEIAELEKMPDEFKRSVENARFEGVCRIDVDGTPVVRGLIFSVPRL